jgi:hypothetical protein
MTFPFPLNNLFVTVLLYVVPAIFLWYGYKEWKSEKNKSFAQIKFIALIFVCICTVVTITIRLFQELNIIR